MRRKAKETLAHALLDCSQIYCISSRLRALQNVFFCSFFKASGRRAAAARVACAAIRRDSGPYLDMLRKRFNDRR